MDPLSGQIGRKLEKCLFSFYFGPFGRIAFENNENVDQMVVCEGFQ